MKFATQISPLLNLDWRLKASVNFTTKFIIDDFAKKVSKSVCFCRHFKTHHHIPTEDQHTFDTLCLADIKPKKTWVEVHEDFYREPPKNPGKILLLYSPDSKPFKDLQQAFRR